MLDRPLVLGQRSMMKENAPVLWLLSHTAMGIMAGPSPGGKQGEPSKFLCYSMKLAHLVVAVSCFFQRTGENTGLGVGCGQKLTLASVRQLFLVLRPFTAGICVEVKHAQSPNSSFILSIKYEHIS